MPLARQRLRKWALACCVVRGGLTLGAAGGPGGETSMSRCGPNELEARGPRGFVSLGARPWGGSNTSGDVFGTQGRAVCTLCEWPFRELLNENANMGVQNNYFVQKKGPFQWVGTEDMVSKILKKLKYRSLREKTTPFPHTGWPWWPFNALFVLCRSLVSAATLANANLGQIYANFARTSRQVRANVNADTDANTIAHEVANSNANSSFFL